MARDTHMEVVAVVLGKRVSGEDATLVIEAEAAADGGDRGSVYGKPAALTNGRSTTNVAARSGGTPGSILIQDRCAAHFITSAEHAIETFDWSNRL